MHHCTTLSGYIFTTKACIDNQKKNLLKSNISSTYPHNIVNFGPLTAEIGWQVWGTPGKFKRVSRLSFVTAATSLTGGQPKTLHDRWPSPGLYAVYSFLGALAPNGILPAAKFTLDPSLQTKVDAQCDKLVTKLS